jgi:hypothetical protein
MRDGAIQRRQDRVRRNGGEGRQRQRIEKRISHRALS